MKTVVLSIVFCLFWICVTAQAPQAFKYQAVARNSSGEVLANKNVSFRISIIQGTLTGTIVYTEKQVKTTNAFGLADLDIGKGTVITGIFSNISWGSDAFFINVEMDPAGGTAYQFMGASQLLSVPYSLYAREVQNNNDADADPSNELQKLTISGTVLTLDKSGGSVTLPTGGTSGDNWGIDFVHTDATLTGQGTTASPLKIADNAITSGKIADGTITTTDLADNAVTTGKINAGAVTGAKIAQAGATNGQVLKWNNTSLAWAPADDATGSGGTAFTLPWSGTTSTDIDNYAFSVISSGPDKSAISGRQTNTSAGSSGYGVYGESLSPYGTAVFAYSNGTSGRGVYANANVAVRANGNARGVDANGDKAVEGRSYSSSGFGVGGYSPVCGVYGESWNSGGKGIYGKSDGDAASDISCGVYGEATTEEAYGVKGYVSNNTGVNFGVYGESNSSNGFGVYAVSKKFGIYAKSTGFQGYGIKGESLADNSIGVYGKANNANGTGVSGEGAKQGIYGLSANYGVFGTSTGYKGKGLVGEATGTNSVGIQGTATNSNSTGVWGEGDNQGVYGVSAMATGKGIYGSASHTTGANFGVYGETASPAGYGIYGKGPTFGVYGISSGANGFGVYGKATSSTGYGVYGDAVKIGVYGVSTSTTGSGIYGEAQKYGVYGFATLSTSYGLYGESPKYGAYGKSTAATGRAVVGEAGGTSSIGVMGIGTNTSSSGVWGEGANYDFYAAGPGENYGAASSIRWKRNVALIPDPLGKLMAIRGVYFDWDKEHGGQHDVGMIAEEVGKVLPEIVVYEENGVDASGMDYSKITPLLVEAIKAQQAEIELLKEKLERLEQRLASSRK